MEEAEYCHRLALMNRGRLIALDTPAALRAGMREPILEVKTAASARAVEALSAAPGVLGAGMFGRAVHVMVSDLAAARAAIPEYLSRAGIDFSGIAEIPPALEDVFIARVLAAGGAVIQ
jgi:ABC-2 type transport system ATP-binding protein